MTTFPALTPSTSELTPGAATPQVISTLAGGTLTTLADLVAVGGTLAMTFQGLTEAQANSIRSHCAAQAGASFPFPTATVPAGDTPVGFAWIYDAAPQVDDIRAVTGSEFYSVSCAFRAIRLRRAVPPSATARLNLITTPALALQPTPSAVAALNLTTSQPTANPRWVPTALDLWYENPTSGASWVDQSNSRALVQATASQQPTVTSSALNGLPALTFDGSNDGLVCSAAGASGVTNCSFFLVMRYNSPATGDDVIAGIGVLPTDLRAVDRQSSNSGDRQSFYMGYSLGNSPTTGLNCDIGGSFHIWSFVQNGATVTIARDGVVTTWTGSSTPSAVSSAVAYLGAHNGGYAFANASVAAWLAEYRAISGADRERYEGYLADVYWRQRGAAVPLVSTHPYYSVAPTA